MEARKVGTGPGMKKRKSTERRNTVQFVRLHTMYHTVSRGQEIDFEGAQKGIEALSKLAFMIGEGER